MTSGAFSLRRLGFIARNTVQEALRQKLAALVAMLALAGVLGAHGFREFHFGSSELKFIADLGQGTIAGLGAVLAVVLTAQLFFSEIERRTVLTLLAKPVGRTEFIVGKFLGAGAIIVGYCGLFTLLLAGVLAWRENGLMRDLPGALVAGRTIRYAPLFMTGGLLTLKLLVLAALTLLIASYARTLVFTVVMGFLVFTGCHLQPLAQALGGRDGATWLGTVTGWLARALPNFQLFDLAEMPVGSTTLAWTHIARVTLYAGSYVAVACGLAAFCFRRREI